MGFIKRQKGFTVLLVIVVIAVVAALWLSTKHQGIISYFKYYEIEQDTSELRIVKNRLLEYIALQPEIYQTDGSGNLRSADDIPAPGYLPCPDSSDTDGDMNVPCGAASADSSSPSSVFGFVPQSISDNYVYFADKHTYYYAIDERFSVNNSNLPYGTRFSPLSPISFDSQVDPDGIPPVLQINGNGSYVAVVIDPGEDGVLDNSYANGSLNFIFDPDASLDEADNADKIIGVTYNDWMSMVVHRVCAERQRYDGTDPNFDQISEDEHWFKTFDSSSNPLGAGWLPWNVECTDG